MAELVNLGEVKAKKEALERLAALIHKHFNPKGLNEDVILGDINDSNEAIASIKQEMLLSSVLWAIEAEVRGRQIIASSTRDMSEIFDDAGLPTAAENLDRHLKDERKVFQDLLNDEQEILGIAKTLGISVENDRRLEGVKPTVRPN